MPSPGETSQTGGPSGEDGSGSPAIAIALTLGAFAALLILMIAVDPLRQTASAAFHGNADEVRRRIEDLGAAGPPIVIGLCLLHAVLFFPAEIIDAAAGFAYGFWLGLPLVMFGWLLSGLAAYAIGRGGARPLLHRFVGAERFERAERTVERGGVTLLLTLRLVPFFPFSIVCYAAGAARVPLWRFAWTTAVGYLPITAISVYLGTRLQDFSATDPFVLGSMVALLGLVLGAHFLVPRSDAQ